VNPLRSVGARLSLALVLVVAVSLGIVYLILVPSLERRLIDEKLDELAGAVPILAARVPQQDFLLPEFLATATASTNARVVVYDVLTREPETVLTVREDSSEMPAEMQGDPIAEDAARIFIEVKRGTVERQGDRFAEAAKAVRPKGPVLLLSAPLHDTLENVDLVERRLLQAGALALIVALILGYGGAWLFARRIRRLEQAAERIARGRFDEPVEDRGQDELGQLARAFEHMRSQLAQLEHARREFIANASHELRTPIFSLGGSLELLADEELDAETRQDFLETMRGQVERLARLATDLLDLSRLDAGRLRIDQEPLDLAELARSLVEEFRGLARADGRPLEVVADEPAPAFGDPERVLQIGRILLENALIHTPSDAAVRLYASVDDGRSVLAVEDEGPGISAEHAPHVFERFYRADGGQASGSGLGLAIARELAEVMGGDVELESQPGRTVFRLALPHVPQIDMLKIEDFSRENVAQSAPRRDRGDVG
jgi:signal transduction histidine kinase